RFLRCSYRYFPWKEESVKGSDTPTAASVQCAACPRGLIQNVPFFPCALRPLPSRCAFCPAARGLSGPRAGTTGAVLGQGAEGIEAGCGTGGGRVKRGNELISRLTVRERRQALISPFLLRSSRFAFGKNFTLEFGKLR